jgi:surfeit locus 1 family protein
MVRDGRRLPFWPTLIVLVAVPAMVALGFWQLDRRSWKSSLLDQLSARQELPILDLRRTAQWSAALGFRRVRTLCDFGGSSTSLVFVAGRNRAGETGYSYLLPCVTPGGERLSVNVGWAGRPDRRLATPRQPVEVTGMLVAQSSEHKPGWLPYRLVAESALQPLEPSAPPSLEAIPNNHLSYAFQWFSFAAALGVIYLIYVAQQRRKR